MPIRMSTTLRAQLLRFPTPLTALPATDSRRRLLGFAALALLLYPGLRRLWQTLALDNQAGAGFALAVLLVLVSAAANLLLDHLAPRPPGWGTSWRAWQQWSAEEKSYLWQTGALLLALSTVLFADRFVALWQQGGIGSLLRAMATGLLWGIVQEWWYRGLLQTGLLHFVGRWPSLLLANTVFTFGPLHWHFLHFGDPQPPAWLMLAAIFAIGAVFGVIYQRSGNLWLPAVLHGLWPLNMQ